MRIVFYYNHCESLGHVNRVRIISDYLKEKGHSVLVINGGKSQKELLKGLNVIKLPLPFTNAKTYFYGSRDYKPSEEVIKKRIKSINTVINDFKPNIFITEFFPFGRNFETRELLPVIIHLKKVLKIKVVASVGYPFITNNTESLKKISEMYDRFFIHCPKDLDTVYVHEMLKSLFGEKTANNHKRVLKDLDEKITYTGYVIKKKCMDLKIDDRIILVSRGSGVIQPRLLLYSILAAKEFPDMKFVVVSGSSTSNQEFSVLKKIAKSIPNVILRKQLVNFRSYLKNAAISISMAGYNTSVETLYFKKNAIIVPCDKFKDPEQFYRTLLLKEVIGSTMIEYKDLTIKKLIMAIRKQLNKETSDKILPIEYFEGVDVIINCLERIV